MCTNSLIAYRLTAVKPFKNYNHFIVKTILIILFLVLLIIKQYNICNINVKCNIIIHYLLLINFAQLFTIELLVLLYYITNKKKKNISSFLIHILLKKKS